MRIFATSVSTSASAAAEHDEHDGQQRELEPARCRVRNEDLGREHEHDPVAGGGTPLQKREVASTVLEQRPLVDHGQLEVRVGVVDGLAAGLGEDDERESDGSERKAR